MKFTAVKQNFQDWITQQWVIFFGKKINSKEYKWLIGPFGNTKGIGEKFISQLAQKESLLSCKSNKEKGLLQSINQLNLPSSELNRLSKNVIDFYENTSNYQLKVTINWNPFFKFFGQLLKILFSNRIEQLNIPVNSTKNAEEITSKIIQLIDNEKKKVRRTIWLRTYKQTNKVIFSGVYETCTIPNNTNCIKAIFPLPNGNATVILKPFVGKRGELILKSSGTKFGDSGFYFLLKDKNGALWAKYIRSFKDNLTVSSEDEKIKAKQRLTFYGLNVLNFEYEINKKSKF